MRETVESIVIAFVLAFLFRTFEAEAFVIPTGSMAPTLMGRHKDVDCPNAAIASRSPRAKKRARRHWQPALEVGGRRLRNRMRRRHVPDVPLTRCRCGLTCRRTLLANYPPNEVRNRRSYNGDRILVNKYVYTIDDPQRWDVVVFKFPGDAQMNYIKRLVGLPGETLRVYQGDLFVKRGDAAEECGLSDRAQAGRTKCWRCGNWCTTQTTIRRRCTRRAGRCGGAGIDSSSGVEGQQRTPSGQNGRATVYRRQHRQRHGSGCGIATLFRTSRRVARTGRGRQRRAREQGESGAEACRRRQRSLAAATRDGFQRLQHAGNAWSGRTKRHAESDPLQRLGLHWVGDLMVEADVDVEEARGELVLDLVEGGQHFYLRRSISPAAQAKLSARAAWPALHQRRRRFSTRPGQYRVGLANVRRSTAAVGERAFATDCRISARATRSTFDGSNGLRRRRGVRRSPAGSLPETSREDPGDLAPAGIGAQGAKLAVTRLQVWRDIYYIADSAETPSWTRWITDVEQSRAMQLVADLSFNPSLWTHLRNRRHDEFPLGEDQFFVMGDNSPESSDARLWRGENGRSGGRPGGEYLERRLLIGKALCVYWPHSWNRIPGTPIPFPLFPNFEDMRLVR